MKNAILLYLITLLFAGSTVLVGAQAPNSDRGQARAQQKQEEAATRLGNNMYEIASRIQNKLSNHLRLYNQFVDKLETRRAKLANQGADVAELDNRIRLIKTDLATTRNSIDSLQSFVDSLDYTQPVSTIRRDLKAEISQVRQQFRNLHSMVSQAVQIAASLNN